jgi:hypothetical protein
MVASAESDALRPAISLSRIGAGYEPSKINLYLDRYGDRNGIAARVQANLLDLRRAASWAEGRCVQPACGSPADRKEQGIGGSRPAIDPILAPLRIGAILHRRTARQVVAGGLRQGDRSCDAVLERS